jgi:hypothetical protein
MPEFGQLIVDLSNAIGQDDIAKCFLFEVKEGSQFFGFLTSSIINHNRFAELHQNIEERSLSDLSDKEAKYAKTLKRLLKGNLYCEALNNDGNKIVKIYSKDIQNEVEHYFSVKTVSGVISEMGSPNLDAQPHINLDGLSYKILTTEDQDLELRKYYRTGSLSLRIKQKISLAKDNVMSAVLLDFRPKSNLLFPDSLSNIDKDELDQFLSSIMKNLEAS